MKIEQVKKLTPFNRLTYFIRERESIRRKKEAGEPPPFTDDEILQRYRFTNVRRMDDKVSRWLLESWYKPYFDHPNALLACTLARQLNNTEALSEVGFPVVWCPEGVQRTLEKRSNLGLKNYSAAYMITGGYGGKNRLPESKPYQTVWRVCEPLLKLKVVVDRSCLASTWKMLLASPGFSSFIAGQVVSDLRWAIKGSWEDKNHWAPLGPGSSRGLARLLHPENWKSLNQAYLEGKSSWFLDFTKFREKLYSFLPQEISVRLEAMDYQACLCEYDKYVRALQGEGRPKQLYRG